MNRSGVPRLVAALAAAAALVAGCQQGGSPDPGSSQGSSGGQLTFPHGSIPPFGVTQDDVPLGQITTFVTADLCTAGGPAQITGITMKKPENLSLVDWGVGAGGGLGVRSGKVLDDSTFSQDPVKGTCAAKDYVELDISVKRTAREIGLAHGFTIETTDGSLFMPVGVATCAADCPGSLVIKLTA